MDFSRYVALGVVTVAGLLLSCGSDDDSTPTQLPETPTPQSPVDVLEALRQIPGMAVEESSSPPEGYRLFRLTYEQPVDHEATGGGVFSQRMILLHRSVDAPLVLLTSGYFLYYETYIGEVAKLLDANQLMVEHRYFEPSRPEEDDFGSLTIFQSASDFHRITESLKPLYPQAWIGTGASKGGMTSVYHRRFFPDDLDGTVAYVAPLSFSQNDPRYIDFLHQVGTESCRQALSDLQVVALNRRATLEAYMRLLTLNYGLTFDTLGLDKAAEHLVLETPFAFWQYSGAWLCASVPDESSSDTELLTFLDQVTGFSNFSDQTLLDFEPYYFQAACELGYPAIDESAVEDLLSYPGTDIAESYVQPSHPTSYSPDAMADVDRWVQEEGSRLLFIYGENDPWSAGAFSLGMAEDSFSFTVAEGNHGSDLVDLGEEDLSVALDALERWTGVSIQMTEGESLKRRPVISRRFLP